MTTAFQRNTAQHGDALALLQSLPDSCAPLAFFDPQFRGLLDKLQLGMRAYGRTSDSTCRQ
jgi:hypothetical protein